MADIIEQGQVSVTGTVIATGGTNGGSRIYIIRTHNFAPYVLRLERYSNTTTSTEVLFEFTLAAGDTFTDSTLYFLEDLDQLILYTDVPGTSYYVYGQTG